MNCITYHFVSQVVFQQIRSFKIDIFASLRLSFQTIASVLLCFLVRIQHTQSLKVLASSIQGFLLRNQVITRIPCLDFHHVAFVGLAVG
jgi:hypothetical protein